MIGPGARVRVLGGPTVTVATMAITVLCLWGVGARLSEAGGQQGDPLARFREPVPYGPYPREDSFSTKENR